MSFVKHSKRELIAMERQLVLGKGFYSEKYSSSVGLDLVKCRVSIEKIDWMMLDDIISRSINRIIINSELPEHHIKYTIAEGPNQPLEIPGNTKYATVIIRYKYFDLKLQSSNIKYKNDIRQLSIYVIPKNVDLGNLNNSSCDEIKTHIRDIYALLQVYGIYLDASKADINYLEINRNFIYTGVSFIDYFSTAFRGLNYRFEIKPKLVPWGELGHADKVGIFADSATVSVHVYNKAVDLEKENNDIYIETYDIYRVEFVVKKAKQVYSWLGTTNAFEIEQKMLENAYNKYLLKYVINPFNAQMETLYDQISQYEIDTSNVHWTDTLCLDIMEHANSNGISTNFITTEMINKLLMEFDTNTQTIKLNRKRCLDLIIKKSNGVITDKDYGAYISNLLMSEPEKYVIKYEIIR